MHDPNHQPPTPGCIAAILPAGGSGQRFGQQRNKLFSLLGNKPLWYHAACRLRDQRLVGRIVMPVSSADRKVFDLEFGEMVRELQIELVDGGKERTDSVRNGLDCLKDDEAVRYVAVHDAARPLVSSLDLEAVFAAAMQNPAAILAMRMPGSVKREKDTLQSSDSVDRNDLWIALTPQVFEIKLLQEAYKKYRGRPATDDAELVQRIGQAVTLVPGSAENIKITHPEDLMIADAILKRQSKDA